MAILAGCVGPGRLPFESPKVVEYLDGNYRRLASCTHQQLGRQHSQLRMTDLRERRTVTISPPEAQWEFSFIDDDGGRQTRLEVTSANGTFPGEHALALGSGLRGVARACGQERAFQPGPPIEQSPRFYMAVNLKTAASLGISLWDVFVARANEVRE